MYCPAELEASFYDIQCLGELPIKVFTHISTSENSMILYMKFNFQDQYLPNSNLTIYILNFCDNGTGVVDCMYRDMYCEAGVAVREVISG